MDREIVEQLSRQSLWLKDSWLWLMREKVLGPDTRTALEVGCGAGHVMSVMSELLDVKGVDINADMVSICRERELDAVIGNACDLPFEDGSFDVVYCSFLLLWLREPDEALAEMARVSRRWVVALAEPDYGARIDHPPELERLGGLLVEDLIERGADPFIGRKLREVYFKGGLWPEVGVHQGVWPMERAAREARFELRFADEGSRADLEKAIQNAAEECSLLQYNPVFWAVAEKYK
jgi:SAM-dependent methyltransferase